MDGWIICDFRSFSTVFQSYQDDGRLIMKGCVQLSSVYGLRRFHLERKTQLRRKVATEKVGKTATEKGGKTAIEMEGNSN